MTTSPYQPDRPAPSPEGTSDLVRRLIHAAEDEGDVDLPALLQETTRILEIDDLHLSRMANVSIPTVNRWMRSVSSPAFEARKAVLLVLAKAVEGSMPEDPDR